MDSKKGTEDENQHWTQRSQKEKATATRPVVVLYFAAT